jgi:hypothetical protein
LKSNLSKYSVPAPPLEVKYLPRLKGASASAVRTTVPSGAVSWNVPFTAGTLSEPNAKRIFCDVSYFSAVTRSLQSACPTRNPSRCKRLVMAAVTRSRMAASEQTTSRATALPDLNTASASWT